MDAVKELSALSGRPKAQRASSPKLLRVAASLREQFDVILEAAVGGDPLAARELVKIARDACLAVMAGERCQPELARGLAQTSLLWPSLIAMEPEATRKALRRGEALGVGTKARWQTLHFRKARGADENYPARLWAKAAVRTLEDTVYRLLMLRTVPEESLILGYRKRGIVVDEISAWVEGAAHLKPFCRSECAAWIKVIRAMIRAEMPDFHLRPEWANVRRSIESHRTGGKGEIQSAILDDIASALKRLAPEDPLPKPAC